MQIRLRNILRSRLTCNCRRKYRWRENRRIHTRRENRRRIHTSRKNGGNWVSRLWWWRDRRIWTGYFGNNIGRLWQIGLRDRYRLWISWNTRSRHTVSSIRWRYTIAISTHFNKVWQKYYWLSALQLHFNSGSIRLFFLLLRVWRYLGSKLRQETKNGVSIITVDDHHDLLHRDVRFARRENLHFRQSCCATG